MSSLAEKSVTFVPMFEGFGYHPWAEKIRHFAMMNGIVDAFDESKKPKKPAKDDDDTDFLRSDRRKYYEMQQKAMGLILSRVSPTIAEALNHEFKVSTSKKISYTSVTATPNPNTKTLSVVSGRAIVAGTTVKEVEINPALMMAYLEQSYGQIGVVELFNLWTSMMRIRAPEGVDPRPTLERIHASHQRLAEHDSPLPNWFIGMVMIDALPPSFNALSTWLASLGTDKTKVKSSKVISYASREFQLRAAFRGGKTHVAAEAAHKISAVRLKPSNPFFRAQVDSQPRPNFNLSRGHNGQQHFAPQGPSRQPPGPRASPSGPKAQKKQERRRVRGGQKGKGKGRASAYIAEEDSDGEFAARAVEEEPESELARKEISERDRERALEIATQLSVQDDSHRLGQLARVVADGRRAQWEKTCEEQDALMARRAAHDPYVEDAVSAVIPSVLSEPARIVSERKRADDMHPVLEKIQATGGLPRSGVMGNHMAHILSKK
jgi:hypothetical protein